MPGPFKPSGGSRGPSRGGPSRGGSARGSSSRTGAWKRNDHAPRERPSALRLAGVRADLERMLRELEDATKALTTPTVKIPDTSVLEHLKELEADAVFAPWRRVRAALADVERARERIEQFKFPKQDRPPHFDRPR